MHEDEEIASAAARERKILDLQIKLEEVTAAIGRLK